MLNLIASVFTGIAAFWGGLLGGHSVASTTMHMHMASSTPSEHHMGMASSTDRDHMGSTTPDGMRPSIIGKVTAINGTTLTIIGRGMPGRDVSATASTTYSIDAASAHIVKLGAGTTTLSAIVTGDTVAVIGTVTGTSITANTIIDGIPMMARPGEMASTSRMREMHPTQNP